MSHPLFHTLARRCVVAIAATSALLASALGQAPSGGDERVNDAMKRAAKFFLEKQDPKTGGIHENMRNEVTMTSLCQSKSRP